MRTDTRPCSYYVPKTSDEKMSPWFQTVFLRLGKLLAVVLIAFVPALAQPKPPGDSSYDSSQCDDKQTPPPKTDGNQQTLGSKVRLFLRAAKLSNRRKRESTASPHRRTEIQIASAQSVRLFRDSLVRDPCRL